MGRRLKLEVNKSIQEVQRSSESIIREWAEVYEWTFRQAIGFLAKRTNKMTMLELIGLENISSKEVANLTDFIEQKAIEFGIKSVRINVHKRRAS
ncbi:hypothetical protein [Alicyclobacillus fodiniaquatilis]|uniref:Uncharacterized protein n=1 Tax=Alicyclobacillus fodiniaquatilis TaxID=1661150 RepID=A0ABW4JKN4_9BACL